MGKKCTICGEEAVFCIKGTSDAYCESCAKENFDDISYLQKVEDEDKKKKEEMIEEAMGVEKEEVNEE